MLQIFVSYSRESQAIVKAMVNDIEELGHNVWLDAELTGGQVWWDQILEKIRKCNIFVYALTPESLESHACKLELDYAYKLNKTILPIRVAEGVSMTLLQAPLSEIQSVDYRKKDKEAVFAVNKAINSLPASSPLTDPLPKEPKVPTSYLGDLKEQIGSTRTLSLEEQTVLFFKLEESMREGIDTTDSRNLLELLRKRQDLLATVASRIDTLLKTTRKQGNETNDKRRSKAAQGEARSKVPRKRMLLWLILTPIVIFVILLIIGILVPY
ncbi:MAG: toll/interleukin-1 receptor domain-containing protein [Candidatus Brocadiaceae bacterium]|nr:toll/interleukin-1 receptor domain-containing protein [Candidatus Brocadiaceae bacterium]